MSQQQLRTSLSVCSQKLVQVKTRNFFSKLYKLCVWERETDWVSLIPKEKEKEIVCLSFQKFLIHFLAISFLASILISVLSNCYTECFWLQGEKKNLNFNFSLLSILPSLCSLWTSVVRCVCVCVCVCVCSSWSCWRERNFFSSSHSF